MAVKNTFLGGTDIANGEIIDGTNDVNDTNNALAYRGMLSEVRMFALSMTGAITKATLLTAGWAICDGTTPAAQGMSSPTITTTPNLEDKFISMSNDETSGTTGGSATMAHTHTITDDGNGDTGGSQRNPKLTTNAASNTENRPPYYELVFFMKVKV